MRPLIGVLVIVGALLGEPRAATSVQVAPHRQPDEAPRFPPAFAALKEQVGAPVGEPVECPSTDPATGDSLQRSTTSFAHQHARSGAPAFTNGGEFWSLGPGGVEYWTGNLHAGRRKSCMAALQSEDLDAQLMPPQGTHSS